MGTSPRVSFGLYALVIKQDSIPSCDDLQAFSKITDLRTDNTTSKPYITYEPDFWLLDGNYKFFPTNTATIHVGLMSLSMSDANGNFADPPVLTVDFSQVHSTDGLTIRGLQASNDYSDSIRVQFYNDAGVLIRDDSYAPASWEFSTEQAIANFKQIKITFYSTNNPYRYLRVTGIDYGELIYFTKTDIKSASVVEEVDPISASVPINTVELLLFSSDATFNIINPTGDYSALQYRQPLAVYEVIGDDTVFIGQFFLDTWENTSDTEIKFNCIDMLGVLDLQTYYGGIWLAGKKVGELLEEIFEAIYVPYDLDSELYDTMVYGWIPKCTYREALQQIAFAIGAYVSCSRSGLIKIYKTILASANTNYDSAIAKAEKGLDQKLTLKTLVTGVEVTAHDYVENTTVTELYNGTLAAGDYTIVFNAPMHDLSITGATITASGANYAIISVASEGSVVLSGQGYTDTTQVFGVYNTTLDANIKTNVLKVTDATLVNYANVAEVTQRVYDYYQQRYLQKVKLFVPSIEVGQTALIDTLYSKQIRGVVEKMSIDLSGGFISQAEITGVVQE